MLKPWFKRFSTTDMCFFALNLLCDTPNCCCPVPAVGPCLLQHLEEPSLLVPQAAVCCPKPGPTASLADKSRFIQDKYVGRHYVAGGVTREAAQAQLWDAVEARNVR